MTVRSAFLTFANIAERDAYWPAASTPLGYSCITLDTGFYWTVNNRTTAKAWTQPWNFAWGTLGSSVPAVTGPGSGTFDVNSSTITFASVKNRIYEITGSCELVKDGTAGSASISIVNAANVQIGGGLSNYTLPSFAVLMSSVQALWVGDGASQTVKLRANTAGTVTITATRGLMSVKDVGGV